MIQKDYLINNPMLIGTVMGDLRNTVLGHPHKDALITIYETGFPKKQILNLIDKIRNSGIGDVKIAGCSLYAIADLRPMGVGVRLNLILTEETDIDVITIPFKPGEEDSVAEELRSRIDEHPETKAAELFFSNMGIGMTHVMEQAFKGREDIGVFGTVTSYRMPRGMTTDNLNILNFGRSIFRDNEFAIGDEIISDGLVAVLFSGEKLRVQMNYALGWHPVGRGMPVTIEADREKSGETALTEIDGVRAVDLFNEYLGVEPNDYFIRNICEFPLMVQREGIDICLIPFDFGKNGELYFNIALKEGELLRFSFASHDEVLSAARESHDRMEEFGPEAVFLILCGNRINFLHEDARLEWECFKNIAPDYALIHGASELYYHHGMGGVLNSAHLAIGMSEGEGHGTVHEHIERYARCLHHDKIVPLSERMSVFMGKMTSQLEGMAKEAQAANIAKSAFLSNMSHEIRTPINAILGMDEMILRESNETEILEYAEDIHSAGNSLLGIVNDVLDFSKIEAGKMDIIPVEYEFASVINDLYNVIRKRAEDKRLEIKLDIDPSIPAILYGDEIRLKQVITNILTNAVKYTEKGSVTLKIRRADSPEDKDPRKREECHGAACFTNPVKLEVSVKDTGIGIKEEDMARLYNAFERVEEERNRTIEGTGLGLNITNQLLGLMESELHVESKYGEGSTFSFIIKQGISRDEPIGDINDRWRKASLDHKKYREKFTAQDASILVVDDTRMNLEVMKNLLKKTRIHIDTAGSGQEALELVVKNAYDIIFLDHRMPNMDGIECFKKMRELPDNKSIDAPVVSLTANAVSGAREEYLTIGFADYLTKPIDSEKLEDMLIRYLPESKVHVIKREEETKTRKEEARDTDQKPLVIMIDDESTMHKLAGGILGKAYRFEAYDSGEAGLARLRETEADLVLLDVKMPHEDGFDVMQRLKSDSRTRSIPVIFLTGSDDRDTEMKGLKAGAWDFVRKPIASEILLQRVGHSINLSRLQKSLQKEVNIKTLRIEHLTQEIMEVLSKAVDAKDHYTNGHSERVAGYTTMLAAKLGMSGGDLVKIHDIGLLHDVGKIGVPEEIINKPARLTDEEFAQIKQHPAMGYDILKTITELPELATGARWHHERFDGKGYPDGRSGEDIPFIARIICVADSYDAMTSNRSYSNIRAQADVRAEIQRCSGSQFDPAVADKMLQLIDSDTDYLMNERGYKDSAVAEFVEELLNNTSRTDTPPEEIQAYAETAPEETVPADTGIAEEESGEEKLPEWLEESTAVDADSGVKNCGSVESYISILVSFQSTVAEKADEIQRYFDDRDWENYTIKVHALKSSARIIGATEISERARLLEAAGDARNLSVIEEDTPALLALFRSYTDSLAPVAEQGDDLPEAPEAMIKDAYLSLSDFAEAMDYETTKMVLDEMKGYRLPAEDKERFDSLRTRLSQLDWDGIKFILGTVF